jgi:ADP-heptose:LPS heptosyltransferase
MNIAIIGCGGIGDCLLSYQCGHYAEKQGHEVRYFHPVRDEVFRVLNHIFPHCKQIDKSFDEGNNFEKDVKVRSKFAIEKNQYFFDAYYWVVPDLLFNNDHPFPWWEFNVHPQIIKQTRLLTHQWKRERHNPIIYCALATSTSNYDYPYLRQLLIDLAKTLPSHTIYFPNITKWGDKELSFGDLTNLPTNVWVDGNPDFLDSLQVLKISNYCISTCNGVSHLAYHLGIPRLILDPQFGKPAWISRWKEDEAECIDRLTDPGTVARIVRTNIEIPQTSLIDRKYLLYDQDWERILMLKKY